MVLFLDTDADAQTGWLGYDFASTRRPARHRLGAERRKRFRLVNGG